MKLILIFCFNGFANSNLFLKLIFFIFRDMSLHQMNIRNFMIGFLSIGI